MRKFVLIILGIIFLVSCSNPKKEAETKARELTTSFSTSLSTITNPETISAFDLRQKIDACRKEFENKCSVTLGEFEDSEIRSYFQTLLHIDTLSTLSNLITLIEEKNKAILSEIEGKIWINEETQKPLSLFEIKNQQIQFINLKNKFPYRIENSAVIFDDGCKTGGLYFKIKDDKLVVQDSTGQSVVFREITPDEKFLGRWVNFSNELRLTFDKDNNLTEHAIQWPYNKYHYKYKIEGGQIMVKPKNENKYVPASLKILNDNKLDHQNGYWIYTRSIQKGPECLHFLFTGKTSCDIKRQIEASKNTESVGITGGSWDSILDSYEEFVDKYIKLLKKAQNGDTSVITEYTECLEKAESFQSKLEGAKADLTMKQVNRLNKINSKLAKAALSVL